METNESFSRLMLGVFESNRGKLKLSDFAWGRNNSKETQVQIVNTELGVEIGLCISIFWTIKILY